jgi:hypothetical protein
MREEPTARDDAGVAEVRASTVEHAQEARDIPRTGEVARAMSVLQPAVRACGYGMDLESMIVDATFDGHTGQVTSYSFPNVPERIAEGLRRNAPRARLRPFGRDRLRVRFPFRIR